MNTNVRSSPVMLMSVVICGRLPESVIVPGVKTLLEEIRDRYFVKIPEIEEVIREELESSGAKHLIPLLYQKSTHSPKGGVWTPGAQQETASTGGKLWIPGQD